VVKGLKRPFQRRAIHPMPVSATAIATYWPALTGSGEAVDAFVEVAVRGLERHLAANRHGVAGVHGQIDNGISS
jgi:hypothetical protein